MGHRIARAVSAGGISGCVAGAVAGSAVAGTVSYTHLIGMDQAQQTISDNGAETYWDKKTSQNYGTYEGDGATYQILSLIHI